VHLNPVRARFAQGRGSAAGVSLEQPGLYLAPGASAQWIRVDRLLANTAFNQDTAAARAEFERRMEARRWGRLRRGAGRPFAGAVFGEREFRSRMREKMEGKLGEHHWESSAGRLWEAKRSGLSRIIGPAWSKRNRPGERRKSGPGQAGVSGAVAQETTLTIKALAARVLWAPPEWNARLHQLDGASAPPASNQARLAL